MQVTFVLAAVLSASVSRACATKTSLQSAKPNELVCSKQGSKPPAVLFEVAFHAPSLDSPKQRTQRRPRALHVACGRYDVHQPYFAHFVCEGSFYHSLQWNLERVPAERVTDLLFLVACSLPLLLHYSSMWTAQHTVQLNTTLPVAMNMCSDRHTWLQLSLMRVEQSKARRKAHIL
jgi:hypothetical protein